MSVGKPTGTAWLKDALAKAATLPGKTLIATDDGEFFIYASEEADCPAFHVTLQMRGWKRIKIGGSECWQHSGNGRAESRDKCNLGMPRI